MRLMLDELYSPEIARQLRARGREVAAVAERPELVSLSDRELFDRMPAERRAIVTNNVVDYLELFRDAAAAAQEHFGLLLTDDRSMPRAKETIGLFVRVLDVFLGEHPGEDALRNQVRWLSG